MSTYNWNKIKEALKRELKGKFTPKMHQYSFIFEDGIELLGKFIAHKLDDEDLDAQELIVLPNIDKFYNESTNRSDKLGILILLSTSFDALLHKVLFLTDNAKYCSLHSTRKGLKAYILELNLLRANSHRILYGTAAISDNSGFPIELCETYNTRNKVHEAKDWSEQDIVKNITSCLVSYLATVFDFYTVLQTFCSSTIIPVFDIDPKDSSEYKQLKIDFESLFEKEKVRESQLFDLIEISEEFNKFLINPSASFAHNRVNDVFLDDIYTIPNIKYENIDKVNKSKVDQTFNVEELIDTDPEEGIKFVFLGDNLSGKSSLCKYLYREYYIRNYLPIYLEGSSIKHNIRTGDLKKTFAKKFQQQYNTIQDFHSIESDRFIIIIDDFHKSTKGRQDFWVPLIRNINSEYRNLIIAGDKLMPIETILNKKNKSKQNIFEDFELYSILEFGPKLRSRIVKKWNSLGVDYRLVDENDILKKNDDSLKHIEKVIGNNYVPAYPFFILTLLQALENKNIQNPNYSIHGFYYELLINDSLKKAVENQKEISLYYNYLTHFSYYLFEKKIKIISKEEFKLFHNLFSKKYEVNYNINKITENLEKAKLIYINSDGIRIEHSYIYYFFTAKYLANNINKSKEKSIIEKMSQRIYRDEYASIIMFLTHLSKDEFIIDQLLVNAKQIFSEFTIAELEKDIEGINNLIKDLPKQVLEAVDIDEFREDELIAIEEREEQEKAEREIENLSDVDYDLDEDINTIDVFTKFTLAMKTIDLLGQIAKKYWGELTGNQKYSIVHETYSVGLRALSFYLNHIQENSSFIVQHLKHIVKQKHIKDKYIFERDIEDVANDFVFRMSFLTCWAIIKRISNSVGDKSLSPTFKRILGAEPFNSTHLIDISIKLDYDPKIPLKDISHFKNNRSENFLSILLLQNLVLNHLYLFKTSYKMKSKICDILGISIKDQRLIDINSKVRK